MQRHIKTTPRAPTLAALPALVERLKAHDQDHEFYPTTKRMIDTVLDHYEDKRGRYNDHPVVLDVGAGRGDFLLAAKAKWCGAALQAIERSELLIAELVRFAKVVGTDAMLQNYLTKDVSLLFCNPPYSEYAIWMDKLLRECTAEALYFVVPSRWAQDKQVGDALAWRGAEATVLASDDFLDGPRRARATVDILYVNTKRFRRDRHVHHRTEDGEGKTQDPEARDLFTRFFCERFKHLREGMGNAADAEAQAKHARQEKRAGLIVDRGMVNALVELYEEEHAHLLDNYTRAVSLDAGLLKALGLDIATIVSTLRDRMDSLRIQYWQDLFSHLDTVTNRLTAKNRDAILRDIGGFKGVDFTVPNVGAVLLWILQNCGQYIDSQVLQVFDDMLGKANIINYKSNQRVYGEGRFRYMDEKPTHVSLDFRIVIESGCYGFRSSYSWQAERLSDTGSTFVDDLLLVATLLGFNHVKEPHEWQPGKVVTFHDHSGKALVEVRAFRNGNMHVRMSQKLTLALNVAVGKLRGWIRDKAEAKAEWGERATAAGVDVEKVWDTDLRAANRTLLLELKPKGTP